MTVHGSHSHPAGPDPARPGPPTRSLHWPLVLGLGLFALARPVTNTVLAQIGVDLGPVVPLGWTAVISLVWIAVVGLSRTASAIPTLVLAGLAYGVFAMVLSGILSPILMGRLAGPLANPIAIVPVLATNAVWGLITGALALAVQRLRGTPPRRAGRSPVSRRHGTGWTRARRPACDV